MPAQLLHNSRVSAGTTLLTRYSYYAGTDNVQTMTLPSGNVLTYSWNGNAAITDITLTRAGGGASQPLVSAVSYQPFGGPLSWTLGNGTVDRRNYDGDGAVSADPLETDIRYAPNKTRIESMTLGGTANTVYGGVRSFAYDNYAHLTELSGSATINAGSPTALDLRYGVDAADNRLAQIVAGAATSYTLDPANNRIASTLTGSTATSHYYDANGNLTGSSPPASEWLSPPLKQIIPGATDGEGQWRDTGKHSRIERWLDCCRQRVRRSMWFHSHWELAQGRWSVGEPKPWRGPPKDEPGRRRRGCMRW